MRNNFARNLKILRAVSGYSEESLEKVAHIPKGKLKEFEEGKSEPSLTQLCQLAKELSTSLDTLVTKEIKLSVVEQ